MLYILITSIVILPVLGGIGSMFQNYFNTSEPCLSEKLISGIITVGLIWTLISFGIPLNIWVEVGMLIAGFLAFFYNKIYKDFYLLFKKKFILFSGVVLIITFFGAFSPYILDHYGYYLPTVMWLSEFGLVKGIANLDLILGQMSVWHILQAGFSNFSDVFLRLNSVLLIIYTVYIFERKEWIHLFFFPVLFLLLQQPTPDLPVIVFSLIVLNEILKKSKNLLFLFTVSLFAFAVKPTVIWLPLLCFFYCLITGKSRFYHFLPGFIILFIFFIKNIWTFGYPVFPIQIVDFDIPWRPNAKILETSARLAMEKTFNEEYSFKEIQKFSFAESISKWLFVKGIKGRIHILFLFTLIVFGLYTVLKKNKIITLVFISVIVKSILVIVFSAQYRFFMDVFFVVAFLMLYSYVSYRKIILSFIVLTSVSGILMVFPKIIQTHIPSFNLGYAMDGFHTSQWYKPSVYNYRNFKNYKVGNLNFNAVQNYPFSFDTPLPAISPAYILQYYEAQIFPQMRGRTLNDGFVWKKISEEEKSQIESILTDLKIEFTAVER